jgi:small-conductance mechanosensitive channel
MAEFGVKIEPIRKGGKLRGKVTGFKVAWWRKNAQQLQEAYKEIKQPKVGRIARLTGRVEQMAGYVPTLDAATATQQLADNRQKLEEQVNAEVADMLEGMRAKERSKLAAE